MNPKRLLITVLCLSLFSALGQAQLFDDLQGRIDRLAIGYSGSPDERDFLLEISKIRLKDTVHRFWEGRGTNCLVASLLEDSEIRTALGICENQLQQMKEMATEYIHAPERREAMEKTVVFGRINADGEVEHVVETVVAPDEDQFSELMSYIFEKAFTPEQRQKKDEMMTAFISDAPFLSVNMFEALGLTDAQKQQMEDIRKEIESEFEAVLEEFANAQMILLDKVLEEFWKQRRDRGLGEQDQQDIVKRLLTEDPVFRRTHNEIQTRTRVFSTQFRTRLYDVLTDEQWARLQELINNPPEHVKVLLDKLREMRGESEESKEEGTSGWTPGPGSWQPGDAIPGAYRIERETRSRQFPRGE
jgi:hypothetical protein